ncbi:hypothetical protein BVRB_027860, partial [Beta vulgaris subsp. vulgaris]
AGATSARPVIAEISQKSMISVRGATLSAIMSQAVTSATFIWTCLLAAATKLNLNGRRTSITTQRPSSDNSENIAGRSDVHPITVQYDNRIRNQSATRNDLYRLRRYFKDRATLPKVDKWFIVNNDIQRLRQNVREGYYWDLTHLRIASKYSNLFAIQYLMVQLPPELRSSAVRYCVDIAAEHQAQATLRFLQANYPEPLQ